MKVKFKLCTKQLRLPKSIKYLGVGIDENLGWKDHVNESYGIMLILRLAFPIYDPKYFLYKKNLF